MQHRLQSGVAHGQKRRQLVRTLPQAAREEADQDGAQRPPQAGLPQGNN